MRYVTRSGYKPTRPKGSQACRTSWWGESHNGPCFPPGWLPAQQARQGGDRHEWTGPQTHSGVRIARAEWWPNGGVFLDTPTSKGRHPREAATQVPQFLEYQLLDISPASHRGRPHRPLLDGWWSTRHPGHRRGRAVRGRCGHRRTARGQPAGRQLPGRDGRLRPPGWPGFRRRLDRPRCAAARPQGGRRRRRRAVQLHPLGTSPGPTSYGWNHDPLGR
jgi:hypothetical protein